MTCKEYLKAVVDPWYSDEEVEKIVRDECPSEYCTIAAPDYCGKGGHRCDECWSREAPEESKPVFEYRDPKPIAKVVDVKEENGGITATIQPIIKDSGDRTKFETGAVRDMRSGKGRFDLVPLEIMARMFDRQDGKSGVMDFLVYFMNTNQTHFLLKALDRFALDTYGKTEKEAYATMFLEVAKHFEEGALKYGPDNWRRGIPTWCYIDSAIRHYMKWTRGDKDEAHDKAFVWNLMCCIWEVDYHKEKDDDC